MSSSQNIMPSGYERPSFPTINLFGNASLEELQQGLGAAVAKYKDFLTGTVVPFQEYCASELPSNSDLSEIGRFVQVPCCNVPGAALPDTICQNDPPIYIYTSPRLLSGYVERKALLRCQNKFVLALSIPPYRTDIPAKGLENLLNSVLPGAYSMADAVRCFVAILPSEKFKITGCKITTRGGVEEHFAVFSREEDDLIPYDIIAMGKTLFYEPEEGFGLPKLTVDNLEYQ